MYKTNTPLPEEIIEAILGFTSTSRSLLCDLALVSQQFYCIIKNDTYWKDIWVNRFPDSTHIIKNNYRHACIEIGKYKHDNPQFGNKNTIPSLVEDVQIVVLGPTDCGKSLLIHRYCNVIQYDWDPTMYGNISSDTL